MKIMSEELIKVLFISLIFAFLTPVGIQAQTPAKGPVYVDLTTAAERSVNAVVYIKTEFMQKNSAWDEFFGGTIWEHFFGSRPSTYPVQAAGSGVEDYVVVVDEKRQTITIKAIYYTANDNKSELQEGLDVWNSQSGNFYHKMNGNNYKVVFDLQVAIDSLNSIPQDMKMVKLILILKDTSQYILIN